MVGAAQWVSFLFRQAHVEIVIHVVAIKQREDFPGVTSLLGRLRVVITGIDVAHIIAAFTARSCLDPVFAAITGNINDSRFHCRYVNAHPTCHTVSSIAHRRVEGTVGALTLRTS